MLRRVVAAVMACVLCAGCAADRIGLQDFAFDAGTLVDFYAGTKLVRPRGVIESLPKRMLHAYIAQVALARIGAELPATSVERAKIARSFQGATEKLNDTLECIYAGVNRKETYKNIEINAQKVQNPFPCIEFDTLLLFYIRSLGGIATEIAHTQELKAFDKRLINVFVAIASGGIGAATGGTSTALASALGGLTATQFLDQVFKIVFDAWQASRSLGALYRDVIALEALIWLTYPNRNDTNSLLMSDNSSGKKILEILGNSYAEGDIEHMRTILATASRDPEIVLSHFAQVSFWMENACGNVTAEADAKNVCKTPPQILIKPCFKSWQEKVDDYKKNIIKFQKDILDAQIALASANATDKKAKQTTLDDLEKQAPSVKEFKLTLDCPLSRDLTASSRTSPSTQ